MSTKKELNISPVGRVEGDLDVKVYMENGVVTRAHTQAAMFRGFEKILAGKDPQSGLIVTPTSMWYLWWFTFVLRIFCTRCSLANDTYHQMLYY